MKILNFIKSFFGYFQNLSNDSFQDEKKNEIDSFSELGFFTASLEHEIRTPLASIDSILYNLKHIRGHDEKVNKAIREIRRETYRISDSLQIIHIIRLTESPEKMERLYLRRFRLEDFLKQIPKTIPTFEYQDKIFFRFDCKTSISITANPQFLEMAFRNLFINAIEAINVTENGRGTIKIESFVDKVNNKTVINICDNGCGLPKNTSPELISAGFSTKKRQKSNSGMGLFVTSKIIKLHGGEIHLFNNEDVYKNAERGTTVSILLPNKF